MKIVLTTPLYPPEIADAALYAKELARRLAPDHQIIVVTYARLPEQLPGVTVVAIDKRQPRIARLRAFRNAFVSAVRDADAVIGINGASVELPLLLATRPASVPLVFCVADTGAHARAGLLERLAFMRATHVLSDLPPRRPEILPLEPAPIVELAAYEASWTAHLATLTKILSHGT